MLRRLRSSASAPSLRSASRRSHTSRLLRASSAASGSRERNLPGVGRGQLVLRQPLPQCGLRLIHGPRMRQEQHVAQTHRAGTVVLGQRVLVELAERRSQTLLHLRGERLTSAGPVDGDKLATARRRAGSRAPASRPPARDALRGAPSRAPATAAHDAASSARAPQPPARPPSPRPPAAPARWMRPAICTPSS